MKQTIGGFIILFTLLLVSCGGVSTSSSLTVIEKGQSNNNKEFWIMVNDSNDSSKEETFKIMIKERAVWNLIEEEKEYFIMYSNNGDKARVLENIQQ